MTDDIQSILLGELFKPNCRIKVRGEHFFTDRKLYSNMYGIAFFSDAENYSDNPHLSPACEKLPGILDDYFSDSFSDNVHARTDFEIRDAITANIPKEFRVGSAKKKTDKAAIECTFLGHISKETSESVVMSYGAIIPTTLCITGDDIISAALPFSPFPTLSFMKGDRTFQTVDYPIPTEPFSPPEDITIDFAVSVKKMEIDLSPTLSGKITLEYSIEVGVTKCEISKMVFEITPINDREDIE